MHYMVTRLHYICLSYYTYNWSSDMHCISIYLYIRDLLSQSLHCVLRSYGACTLRASRVFSQSLRCVLCACTACTLRALRVLSQSLRCVLCAYTACTLRASPPYVLYIIHCVHYMHIFVCYVNSYIYICVRS